MKRHILIGLGLVVVAAGVWWWLRRRRGGVEGFQGATATPSPAATNTIAAATAALTKTPESCAILIGIRDSVARQKATADATGNTYAISLAATALASIEQQLTAANCAAVVAAASQSSPV
jgi:hypothetical protein